MKKFFTRFRNRYLLSTSVAVLYILVLHNTDIYTLYKRKQRVAELEAEIDRKQNEIVVMKEKYCQPAGFAIAGKICTRKLFIQKAG
ncbi:MAG: hypothetical protein IPM77_11105 [Crocinitomicaceae bacterium]|nr:hypothetical protein [Crocinitomicaceae bacterium]